VQKILFDMNIKEKKARPNRKRAIHKHIGYLVFTLKCRNRRKAAAPKKQTVPQTNDDFSAEYNNRQPTATKRLTMAILAPQ